MQGAWGVDVGILGGVCRPVLQIMIVFETKKCHFFTPVFRPDRFNTRFQTWLLRNYVIIT